MFDEAIPPKWPAQTLWIVAASVLLHILLIVVVVRWHTAIPPVPPAEESIPVDVLTSEQFEALIGVVPAAVPTPQPPTSPSAPGAAESPMLHAATILSGRALAEPRNRPARDALPRLNPTERMVQLCNLEALEQLVQLRPDLKAEMVSAYARQELAIAPDLVDAAGAAFRSGDDWYELRYRCRLSPGDTEVVAFDFLAGDRIPPARVDALDLPVGR